MARRSTLAKRCYWWTNRTAEFHPRVVGLYRGSRCSTAGQTGAPDKGVSGPGVCGIISTGDPTQTYDGTPSVGPAALCTVPGIAIIFTNAYGCGRPNAFQGRMGTDSNVLEFLGVPFDPSGTGTRTFRITNLRADAAIFGPTPTPILATVAIYGNVSLTLTPTQVQIGFAERGMNASLAPATTETVRVTEGFASSWKARNVANTLANAAWSGVNYVYVSPDQNDPTQAAQNVPAVLYNAEDGFQWQNNVANAPPSPDPPVGYQISGTTPNLEIPAEFGRLRRGRHGNQRRWCLERGHENRADLPDAPSLADDDPSDGDSAVGCLSSSGG